jgi:hypothetical protein
MIYLDSPAKEVAAIFYSTFLQLTFCFRPVFYRFSDLVSRAVVKQKEQ